MLGGILRVGEQVGFGDGTGRGGLRGCGRGVDGRTAEARPGVDGLPLLVGGRRGAGAHVGGLVEFVSGVPLDPFERDPASGEGCVDGLEEVDVLHGLAVGLLPALALPTGHPLGDRVDDVLRVAQDEEVVLRVGGLLQQVEDGLELAHVVGAVRPPSGVPALAVDEPCPARGSGIGQGGAVGGSDDHGPYCAGIRVRAAAPRCPSRP
jgi:hypothetical protein